jgi:hypothetical protein
MNLQKSSALTMKFHALRWLRIDQRCMFIATEVGGYSADVLGINEKKMVEIEVKVTMADFKNDFKKSKHLQYTTYDPATGHDYAWYKQWVPTHFYFAVPAAMVEEVKAYLETAKAPRAKDYGVISAEDWTVVKRAKWLHKNPPGNRAKATCALRMGSELIRFHEAWV